MFKQQFQGGTRGVEILSASGSEPGKKFKMTGSATKEYDKGVKGYVYAMDKPSNTTNMQCPKSQRESLGVTQRLLCFQIICPIGDLSSGYSIELVCLDSSKQRRRLMFGSAIKKVSSNSLHTQIPLIYDMCSWTTLVIDLPSIMAVAFPGCAYASLEFINIHPTCRVRKIFSLPTLNTFPHCIPGEFDFPDHISGALGINASNGKSNIQYIDEKYMSGQIAKQAALESERKTKNGPVRTPFRALAIPAACRGPSRAFVNGVVGTASGTSLKGVKDAKGAKSANAVASTLMSGSPTKPNPVDKTKTGMGGTFGKARVGIRSKEPPTEPKIEFTESVCVEGKDSLPHSARSTNARKSALQHINSRYLDHLDTGKAQNICSNDESTRVHALEPTAPPAASVFRISTDSLYTHDYPANNEHGSYSVTRTNSDAITSPCRDQASASVRIHSPSKSPKRSSGATGAGATSLNSSINSNLSGISNFWSSASIGSVSRRNIEPGINADSITTDPVAPHVPLSLLLGLPSAVSAPGHGKFNSQRPKSASAVQGHGASPAGASHSHSPSKQIDYGTSNSAESCFELGNSDMRTSGDRSHVVQNYRSDCPSGRICSSGKLSPGSGKAHSSAGVPVPVAMKAFLQPSVRDRQQLYTSVLDHSSSGLAGSSPRRAHSGSDESSSSIMNSINMNNTGIGFIDARRASCEDHLQAALQQHIQEYGDYDESLASLNESVEEL